MAGRSYFITCSPSDGSDSRWDIGKMWAELVESAKQLGKGIERYYARYMEDNAAILAFGSAEGNIQALATIRSHQKDKAVGGKKPGIFKKGGHTSGNFILYDTAGDGRPLIMISSKQSKEIKDKHVQGAVKVTLPNAKHYSGTYKNTGKMWSFVVTKGSAAGAAQMKHNAANRGSKGVDPWSTLFSPAMKQIDVNCMPEVKVAL